MAKYLGFNGTHAGAEVCYLASDDSMKNYIEQKMSWVNFVSATEEEYENALREKTQFYWNGSSKKGNTYNDGTPWAQEHVDAITTWKVSPGQVENFISATLTKIETVLSTYTDLPNINEINATKTALNGFDVSAQSWVGDKSDIVATNAYDYLIKKGLTLLSPLQII
tara:strand:+ start:597 stop:1097 length:501 start_codon:yes stop_codon:yes gene_type:complete